MPFMLLISGYNDDLLIEQVKKSIAPYVLLCIQYILYYNVIYMHIQYGEGF